MNDYDFWKKLNVNAFASLPKHWKFRRHGQIFGQNLAFIGG